MVATFGTVLLDTLSNSPEGGRLKMIILGLLLPAPFIYVAYQLWHGLPIHESIDDKLKVFTDTERQNLIATVLFASIGGIFHFRWFWGLVPYFPFYKYGTLLSLLGTAVAILASIYEVVMASV